MKQEDDASRDKLPNAACPGQIEIPTPRERESLDRMRALKEDVREVKKRLRDLKSSGNKDDLGKISALEEDIRRLKTEWESWEKRWKKAVKERMIYLGHDEG